MADPVGAATNAVGGAWRTATGLVKTISVPFAICTVVGIAVLGPTAAVAGTVAGAKAIGGGIAAGAAKLGITGAAAGGTTAAAGTTAAGGAAAAPVAAAAEAVYEMAGTAP